MKIKFKVEFCTLYGELDLEDYDAEEISHIDWTSKEQVKDFLMEVFENEGFEGLGIEVSETDIDEFKEIRVNGKEL